MEVVGVEDEQRVQGGGEGEEHHDGPSQPAAALHRVPGGWRHWPADSHKVGSLNLKTVLLKN